MADNTQVTNGTGDSIRDKDRAGVKTQIVGVDLTIGDATETLMGAANPLPSNISSSGSNAPLTNVSLTAAAASTITGAANTTGSAVFNVGSYGNISFHLSTSAFVGTVVFEQSFDPAGAAGTWAAVPCIPEDTSSAPLSSLSINTAVAYIRQFTQGMFGASLFRVRVSAFTSGSITVYGKPGPGWVEGQPALAPSNSQIGIVSTTMAQLTTGTGAGTISTPAYITGTAAVTTSAVLVAAPAAGLSIYVTDMEGSNEGTTSSRATLLEGTTVKYARFMGASGGGYVTNLRTPWKLPAATALNYQISAATTYHLTVNYYVAP